MKLANKLETRHAYVRGNGRCYRCGAGAMRAAAARGELARLYCEACLVAVGAVRVKVETPQLGLGMMDDASKEGKKP